MPSPWSDLEYSSKTSTETFVGKVGLIGRSFPYSTKTTSFTSFVEKWSIGHRGFSHLDGVHDRGGPFLLKRKGVRVDAPVVEDGNGTWWTAPGYIFPITGNNWVADPFTASQDILAFELNGLGTTAISRCAPTKPLVDGAVAIAELVREGIPHAPGESLLNETKKLKRLSKNVGDEYLNVEFGWKPMVNDLMSFVASVDETEKHLQQLERNSGRTVRRKYNFPESVSSSESTTSHAGYPTTTNMSNGVGTRKLVTKTEVSTWFEGAFMYHFDLSGSDSRSQIRNAATKARHLYGLKLTPDVLWNLTPWSWAADWVGNIGDVMTNVSLFSTDGLVMPYGYIMRTSKVSRTYTLVTTAFGKPYTSEIEYFWEQKCRLPATPFGFGLSFDGFSSRQLAIIAALGLTR